MDMVRKLKVLFISGNSSTSHNQWDLSGCGDDGHLFFHKKADPYTDSIITEIGRIDPDVIVISFDIGSNVLNGPVFVHCLQESGQTALLIENTSVPSQSFSSREVKLDYNAEESPEKLAEIISLIVKNGLA